MTTSVRESPPKNIGSQQAPFPLPDLPYPKDALAPVISAETLEFHHDKHQKKYIDTTNELLKQHAMPGATLVDVVCSSSGKLFNNAAQAWNHEFYWHSLSPQGMPPSAALARQLEKDFGGIEQFKEAFANAAMNQFGSGWAWLVLKNDKLEIATTANADTPLAHGVQCLLTLDVWEHAYYIDYRNKRDEYLREMIAGHLNWEFAESNM